MIGEGHHFAYRLWDIQLNKWRKLARDVRVDVDTLIGRIAAMAEQLPDAVSKVRGRAQGEGLDHPILKRLSGRLTERALGCRKILATGTGE